MLCVGNTAWPHLQFNSAAFLVSRAVRSPAYHPALVSCAEALLWTTSNGFVWLGVDIAAQAASTCVALLGRNEGGLMLNKGTSICVLDGVHK